MQLTTQSMPHPRVRAGIALAVTTLLLAACSGAAGRDVDAASGVEEPSADQLLRLVGPFEVQSIDPSTAGGVFSRLQVAETLVDADVGGQLQPGLAERWEVADDQLEWRFWIREGAVFHDGTTVDAPAVVNALQLAREKADTPLASAPVRSIAAAGEVVRIRLDEPFAPLPAVLAHTSAQILAPASYDDGTVVSVIGTGPYEIAELRQPDRVDVVASDDWQGEPPAITRVRYEAVGRAETRALMAESGQSHLTFGMDPTSLRRVDGADGIRIESVTLPRTIQLKANADHESLAEVTVRRALSMALDREAMAAALLRDPEMAATQLFPPSLEDWHQADIDPLVHDPDGARQLLEDAGWQVGEDGIRVRDGQRLALELRTFTDRPELPILATAIQAAFADVGVALDVRIGNSSDIPAGHQDGSLQLALYARNFALVPDPTVTLIGDFGPEGGDWGAMGWTDPTLSGLLADMTADVTTGEDAERRSQVAGILQTELPVIPVAWYRQSAVVDQDLEGVMLDPLERSWLLTGMSWTS